MVLFSIIFIIEPDQSNFSLPRDFSYSFANPFGLPLTISRFIFLLLCTCAFIIPYRAGLWNIGMTGQLYAGALAAYGVLLRIWNKRLIRNSIYSAWDSAPDDADCRFLGWRLAWIDSRVLERSQVNINEIVVTMMLNFITFWLVSFMIKEGGLFMNPGGRGESFELPYDHCVPLIHGRSLHDHLSPLAQPCCCTSCSLKLRSGIKLEPMGRIQAAASYAGISKFKIPLLVFIMGGALAGLAGYHYFAAVPGVYKIARNYGFFGDLAFYGIICGLISQGNPLAAIPVAFLFGGLSIGGRFVQGKLGMSFGVDFALLGVLMITLVAFQFFYRYKIVRIKVSKESLDVGIPH